MVQSAIRGDYGVRSGAAAVVGRPAGRQQLEIRIFIYFVLWNNCFGILIYFVILDLQGYFSYYTVEPKAISRPDIMLFVTVCQKKLPKFIAKSKLLHIWSYLFGPLAMCQLRHLSIHFLLTQLFLLRACGSNQLNKSTTTWDLQS